MKTSVRPRSYSRSNALIALEKNRAFMLAPLLLFSVIIPAQETSVPLVTDHQAEGNLQSNNRIGCIAIDEARNTYTPADLYKGVAACITADNMRKASSLYALAGTYGRFDTLRVTDRTSHQALIVIQMQDIASLPQDKKDRFQQQLASITKDDSSLASLCSEIRTIGPPNYVPSYMIQHGMGAFLRKKGNGIDASFDAVTGWEHSLTSYLHCPPVRKEGQ